MARRDSRGSSIAGIGQLRRRLAWPAASGKLRPPLPSLSLQQPRRSGRDRMSVIGHSEGTVGRRARFGWAGANAGVVDELRTSWQVGCRAVLRLPWPVHHASFEPDVGQRAVEATSRRPGLLHEAGTAPSSSASSMSPQSSCSVTGHPSGRRPPCGEVGP